MTVKLLTEHHLGFLSLKGGCRGSSESTLVKMPHCWKLHVAAHFTMVKEVVFANGFFLKTKQEWLKSSVTLNGLAQSNEDCA